MKYIIALFTLLLSTGAFAQQNLSPEMLWQLERVGNIRVSPDAKSVIYTQRAYNLDENKGSSSLHKLDLQSGKSQRIGVDDHSVIQAEWRPDGKKIGFLSARSGSVQLYEMNPDGSNVLQVSNFEDGISNFAYSPTMNYISFTQDVKTESSLREKYADLPLATAEAFDDLMFRHWDSWTDFKSSHLMIAKYSDGQVQQDKTDLMKGEPFDCPLNPFGGAEHIAWSKDGKYLCYVSKKLRGKAYAESTNSELYLYEIGTGTTKLLTNGLEGYDTDPVFSPDGSMIAWLNMARAGFEADKNTIWVLDVKTGQRKSITGSIDQSFSNIVWSKDQSMMYAISGVKATFQAFAINLKGKTFATTGLASYRQITKGDHNINSIAMAGEKLIGSKNTMLQPAEIFSWTKKDGTETKLTSINASLMSSVKSCKMEKMMIDATDGKEILTWVIYPPDFDPNKKYPTLLYCQGGPQSAVSQFFSYRWNFMLMASQGYIVVAPNRRGLPTFGQKWNDDISKDWGGQAMKDYLSAIDFMAKKPFVDETKLGCVGASYGGYSVYFLAGMHEGRFKTFISHCGLFNLESWYGSTEELFFANWDIGGPYWKSPLPTSYEKFSPHRFVQNWDTPILVIHGEKDFRVPINQGIEAFNAAQQLNVPSRFLYFPDEGHWVLSPQNGVLWHREYFEWLNKFLK